MPQILSLIGCQLFIPFTACGIVMRPGVYDRVRDVVVREVRIVRTAVESKLKDTRSGYLKLIAKRINVRSDQPQILGNERYAAYLFLHSLKEISSWTLYPLARLGCRQFGRNMPCRCKGAEVIQTNHIHVHEQSAQAIDAPTITSLLQRVPIVDRVAPELPL